MQKISVKLTGIIAVVLMLCGMFAMQGFAADDGWTYADTLPSGVTSSKYTIQYNNTYKTTAKTSPGSGWTNKGLAYSKYENSGEPYESAIELETSQTRELVSYYYYHFCSASKGVRVNFTIMDPYNHYDAISPNGSFYEAGQYIDDDDPRYKSYRLKYYDGSDVYCSSGFSCDGAWGTHGARSYVWYKMCKYQDKVQVNYYNFEKQSGWTSQKDSSASSCTVRYKLNHTHSYSSWVVSKKASFTSDGSKYRICKTCNAKQTAKIYKLSSVKLSATSYEYNGKAKKPTVTVTNSNGTKISTERYTVSYSKGRKAIGTYTVTVKLKGTYYSGKKTLTFKIVPPQVKNLTATAKKDAVTLKWSKVSGDVKYRVYTYNASTKEIEHIATVSGTSYTHKSLSSKNTYRYVVKAYKKVDDKKYYSKQSSVVKCQPYGKPSQVTELTSSAKTSSTVTLSWKKAGGNSVRYYIYSYNSSTQEYTRLGKTTSTSYTVSNLKANKTYKFAVRAYSAAGDGYWGKRSSVYSVKTYEKLTSPAVTGLNASTEKKLKNILITWDADSSVNGYQIYRSASTKSDTFKLIKTVSSDTTTSYRDTDVVPGTTYYYKVRTYKVRGGEKAYGTFTSAMKITSYGAWKESLTIYDYTYSFSNSYSGFGYPENYVIPLSSYHIVFGNTALAQQMYDNYGEWGGSCHGMSATAAMMTVQSSGVSVSSFNTSASKVSELKLTDNGSMGITLKQFIEAMQVSQLSSNIYENRVWNDLESLLTEVCWVPYTGKPVIIGIRNDIKKVSHALLALKAVKVSNTQINIEVYDPNFPSTMRNLILYTNTAGKVTGWYYKNNDKDNVGSAYVTSNIEYLTYDSYSEMWTKRGTFTSGMAESNALMVNSASISIYDGENNLVARLDNGEFVSEHESIYAVDTDMVFGTDESAPALIYLPTDETYTVVNEDDSIEEFEATMVNVDRSAEVITRSDTVTFTVSDKQQINEVCIEAENNEQYSIVLDSSESIDENKLEIIGDGEGESVVVSQTDGETRLENCENAEIYLDGSSKPLSEGQIDKLTS